MSGTDKRKAEKALWDGRPTKRMSASEPEPAPAPAPESVGEVADSGEIELYLVPGMTDVPGPASLLDQVLSTSYACPSIGTRVQFAYQQDPEWVRGEIRRYTQAGEEALRLHDEDIARRRAAGECVKRRDRTFDGIGAAIEPDMTYSLVRQVWNPRVGARQSSHSAGASASASAPAPAGPPSLPELHTFLTHQVVTRAAVTFEACGPLATRKKGMGAMSHVLSIRLDAGNAASVLEVRFFLHEGLVHAMQHGPMSETEDALLRRAKGKSDSTWLDSIPFVIALKGSDYEPFSKVMHFALPAECSEPDIPTDALILRNALRIHAHTDFMQHSQHELVRTEVYATKAFLGAVTTVGLTAEEVEAQHYHLRWLQLTPITAAGWRADHARSTVEF